jgi:hypothetical protein
MEKKNCENQEKFTQISNEVIKSMEKKCNKDEILAYINKINEFESKIKELAEIDASNKDLEKSISNKITDFESKAKKLQ